MPASGIVCMLAVLKSAWEIIINPNGEMDSKHSRIKLGMKSTCRK